MTQLCTRRDEIEQCLNTGVEFEVVESGTDGAPVGVRLCGPCGWNLERRGMVTLADLPSPGGYGAFWRQVAPRASGCWEWTGNVGDHGYGRFWDASARCNRLAHRVALGFRQALSDEMQVDHLCRNRICVRPDHLEEVTQQENIRRALPFRVTR